MLFAGELFGVLIVAEMGDHARRFSEEDLNLLFLFAGQAAGAIRNSRLFEEMQRQLAELRAVNAVSTLLRSAKQ